jgi:hypothetical protein
MIRKLKIDEKETKEIYETVLREIVLNNKKVILIAGEIGLGRSLLYENLCSIIDKIKDIDKYSLDSLFASRSDSEKDITYLERLFKDHKSFKKTTIIETYQMLQIADVLESLAPDLKKEMLVIVLLNKNNSLEKFKKFNLNKYQNKKIGEFVRKIEELDGSEKSLEVTEVYLLELK